MNGTGTSHSSIIVLKRTDSNEADFKHLVKLLDQNLVEINGDIQADYDQYNLIDQIETVVIAYADGTAAGCGCFKKFDEDTMEIKRMYVNKPYRQKGIAFKILNELEAWAQELGYGQFVLETGRRHHEALALYHKMGYVIIPNYGPYIAMEESICMRKVL
jgi:GNAT superfamily N-acetyltransferase